MSIDRTIRRAGDAAQQQIETYRYWQSLPMGNRLSAVWEVSQAAYSFAAAFKGVAPTPSTVRWLRTGLLSTGSPRPISGTIQASKSARLRHE